MAEAPNRTLRWGVIAVAALAGLGLFIATLRNTNNQSKDGAPQATKGPEASKAPDPSKGPEAAKPRAARR